LSFRLIAQNHCGISVEGVLPLIPVWLLPLHHSQNWPITDGTDEIRCSRKDLSLVLY